MYEVIKASFRHTVTIPANGTKDLHVSLEENEYVLISEVEIESINEKIQWWNHSLFINPAGFPRKVLRLIPWSLPCGYLRRVIVFHNDSVLYISSKNPVSIGVLGGEEFRVTLIGHITSKS